MPPHVHCMPSHSLFVQAAGNTPWNTGTCICLNAKRFLSVARCVIQNVLPKPAHSNELVISGAGAQEIPSSRKSMAPSCRATRRSSVAQESWYGGCYSSQLGIPPPKEGELEAPFRDKDTPLQLGRSRRPMTARMSMIDSMRAEYTSATGRVRFLLLFHRPRLPFCPGTARSMRRSHYRHNLILD